MKISIEIAVYTASAGSFGRVSGSLEFPAVPQIGATVSFLFTNNEVASIVVPRFSGILRITDMNFTPNALREAVSINLEDLVLDSQDDARKVMKYLEEGFGLYGDEYEQDS